MDSVVISIVEYRNVIVPSVLVIPHVTAEHPQYRPIYAFPLVVRLRVEGACACVRNPPHLAYLAKAFRCELALNVGYNSLRHAVIETPFFCKSSGDGVYINFVNVRPVLAS